MEYNVNNTALQYNTAGQKGTGNNIVLLRRDVDLTAGTRWGKKVIQLKNSFRPKHINYSPPIPTPYYVIVGEEQVSSFQKISRSINIIV